MRAHVPAVSGIFCRKYLLYSQLVGSTVQLCLLVAGFELRYHANFAVITYASYLYNKRLPSYNHSSNGKRCTIALDNSYFNRLLSRQFILEAIIWNGPGNWFLRLSIHKNCPDNRFRWLSINWNCPDNEFRRPSIHWKCVSNWFRVLSMNWNCLKS